MSQNSAGIRVGRCVCFWLMNVRLFGCVLAMVLMSLPARAQTTIDSPVTVPLHFTETSSGNYKLGIYVGIGDGATPALFEFDTGGTGFYAAYSSHSEISPWWGTYTTVSPEEPITNAYDSGLTYTGRVAEAAVSLFASAGSSTPLITTAPTTQLGQMDKIDQINPSSGDLEQKLWSNDGNETPYPPIDGAFYGDFGMNLAYNQNPNSSGISNIVAQLNYSGEVTAGFRIHLDLATQTAYLQIGLTAADISSPTALYFLMNLDGNAPGDAFTPVSDMPFYSQQLFNATIGIQSDEESLTSVNVGITPDTGASTTLHNTQNSPSPLPGEYDNFIDWKNAEQDLGDLQNGLEFGLSGLTIDGETVSYFGFTTSPTTNFGNVMVQNNRPDNPLYYLNTGISLFYGYDLIYDMHNGIIGLEAVPEPSISALLLVGAAAAWFRLRRRHV